MVTRTRLTAALVVVAGLALVLFVGAPTSPTWANSLLLDATTKALELETSSSASTDYIVAYADHTASAFTPGMNHGNVAAATTTTILAAPAASTQRQVKWISVRNRSTTTAQTATLKLDVSGTEYHLGPAVTLAPGEALRSDAEGTLTIFTAQGLVRTQASDISGYNGQVFAYAKAGTAKDAAGYAIAFAKDAGFPGAYSLGTPGINGVNTDCSVASQTNPAGASQMGSHLLQDPTTGSLFLTAANISSSVTEFIALIDPVWYNTGIVVTTTSEQTITMAGPLPPRDINGSTNGEGINAALLTTAANTNAATIANTTLSYTDQDGNAGNTATFQALVGWQAPATPVIGTFMRFQLAAGDRGIRSVQSITLGTSYGGGSLSLVLYRALASLPNPAVLVGSVIGVPGQTEAPGVRLYNDSCVWAVAVANATTASNIQGTYNVMER